jgi:RNA polymerase sigma-70 factor (ECF subfamily)
MEQQRDRNADQDDATLVASVLAGERGAFDILLQRYSSSVLHFCTALLGNTVEAQDIAQEASLQAFLGLSSLREPARFAAWFHAIAANLARSALRRRRECSLYTLNDDDTIQTLWIDAPLTLEEYQAEKEMRETILLALQDLSLVNRQAVIGFYLQGYSYEELAQLLGVPISTVKGRLFQGRQQLKTLLRPLADTLFQPLGRQRKEQNMTTSDLVELQIHSVRILLLTQHHVAILRDPHSEHGLAIRLTSSEADALALAFGARVNKDEWPGPFIQDLSQRLLESLGGQLQRVMINALAGQTLYATLTIAQGEQTREIDMRLSESLALAIREGAPLFITRSLFENAATLDIMAQASESSWQELDAKRNDAQKLGREERLLLEEDVRGAMAPNRRIKPTEFWERLWTWLLESLTGTQDDIPAAQLRTLDIATTFPTRETTWDGQPMIAIRAPDQAVSPRHKPHPDQRETAWILVRPETWERITEMLQHLQKPEEHNEEQEPKRTVANPFPNGLPPEIQQRVEERLAWLIEEPDLRTALLRDSQGTVIAWKGADTQDTVQRFNSALFSERSREHLANEDVLDRQLGDQPQKVEVFGNKKAIRQDLPKEAGGIMGAGVHRSGWEMVVLFEGKNARDLKEETHQRLRQARKELEDILAQRVPN